jgi:hypothetical protein
MVVLIALPACRRERRSQVTTVEEEPGALVSVIHTADPRAAMQLVRGFHDIEHSAWRWTRGQFTVALKPPAGSAEKGATLEVKLTVPEPIMQHVKGTTLSAKIGNIVLEPQSFNAVGDHVYKREVPGSALAGDAVTIDFTLDRFLAAGEVEGRELGIIVSSVGLLAK